MLVHKGRKIYLGLIGVWTLVALFTSTQLYLKSLDTDPSWIKLFLVQLLVWQVWGLLTPLIFFLGKRFRIDRQTYFRGLLVHIPIALAMVVLYLLFYSLIWNLIEGDVSNSNLLFAYFKLFFLNLFHWHFFIYMAIVGVGHAMTYYGELRARELEAVKLEKELLFSQLNTLKAQLEPHFLFNTLNNVISSIKQDKSETAIQMLIKLSEFLRVTLVETRQEEIPLQMEIDFVQKYLEIEQYRNKNMSILLALEENTKKALIPSFILQPLVENAIKHGISKLEHAQKLEIGAETSKNKLRIWVYNEGPSLKKGFREKYGIGLRNTIKRLEKLYKEKASIHLLSVNDGVMVELFLPYKI
ncbi:MAG: histidine kinase [Bacteroidota bacterium]